MPAGDTERMAVGDGQGSQPARRSRLGEILVDAGLVTRDQIEAALERQDASGPLLGELLVSMGFVSEVDIALSLARQLKLSYLSHADLNVDATVARLVPEETARRYGALPVRWENDRILVAMTDPGNVYALDDIAYVTGSPCSPVVVTRETLERGLDEVYGEQGIQEALARAGRGAAPPPGRPQVAGGDAQDRPMVKLAASLLDRAIDERASDIHLEPLASRLRVRYRVDGVLYDVLSLSLDAHAALVSRVKIMASMDISERRAPQDGRFQVKDERRDVDIRVSSMPTIFGEKVVLRLLDKSQSITRLDQLGLPADALEQYRRITERPYGMVLVTGPTGSGKTTTLTATLHRLNSPELNIITIEDPVEYQVDGVNQVQVNTKAGLTFASGLRSILRQDPNVIMVGEIRDRETAQIAIRSALTGHVVLSSMHTNDAAGALTRLLDWDIEPFLIASAVTGALAQRLVRTLCPRCRRPQELPEDAPERLSLGLPRGPLPLYSSSGCAHCDKKGFKGRTGIFELLPVTPRIRELINRKSSADVLAEESISSGMRPLVQDGVAKALQGVTTLEEVQRVAFHDER